MPDCNRGANGGANEGVSHERSSSLASPNSLKTQRPALACAGRAGLRIESSTTELRWAGQLTYQRATTGGTPPVACRRSERPKRETRGTAPERCGRSAERRPLAPHDQKIPRPAGARAYGSTTSMVCPALRGPATLWRRPDGQRTSIDPAWSKLARPK